MRATEAAGFWLHIHRCADTNLTKTEDAPPLPQWLVKSATRRPAFGEGGAPLWLGRLPNVPERFASWFDLGVPIDRCAARIIERYQLPWLAAGNLRMFILTLDTGFLTQIAPFDVMIEQVEAPIGKALRITIDGVDEYTTQKQWLDIFEQHVRPRQESYWEQRGDLPHSKQMELDSLTEEWVAEFYRRIVDRRIEGKKIKVDQVIESMRKDGLLPLAALEADQATYYRLLRRLDMLWQTARLRHGATCRCGGRWQHRVEPITMGGA